MLSSLSAITELPSIPRELPPHIFHLVTVEDQERLDKRIRHILQIPGKDGGGDSERNVEVHSVCCAPDGTSIFGLVKTPLAPEETDSDSDWIDWVVCWDAANGEECAGIPAPLANGNC